MEYFLAIEGAGAVRKERFDDLGAALERASELAEAGAAPFALTDTGERLLLGRRELERLYTLTSKFAPVDDQAAKQLFTALSDDRLDALCRWLIFRMRASGVSPRARLALLGSVLDAASPDQ